MCADKGKSMVNFRHTMRVWNGWSWSFRLFLLRCLMEIFGSPLGNLIIELKHFWRASRSFFTSSQRDFNRGRKMRQVWLRREGQLLGIWPQVGRRWCFVMHGWVSLYRRTMKLELLFFINFWKNQKFKKSSETFSLSILTSYVGIFLIPSV